MFTLKELEEMKINVNPSEVELPLAVVSIYSESVKVYFPSERKKKWISPEDFVKAISNVSFTICSGLDIVGPGFIGKVFPERKKRLKFIENGKRKSKTVKIPATLLIGTKSRTYHIFIPESKELTLDTALYIPNIPNVFAQGKICFGNTVNQVPYPQTERDLKDAYEMFFSNYFTGKIPEKIEKKSFAGRLGEVLMNVE